jgi:hypothetical protein
VGGVPDGWDDDQELLAALRKALGGQGVPPEFVQAGKAAYTWRTIDAELAELTYDSAQESLAAAGQRAEDPSVRTLTFSSAHLTIELEATGNAILGQIVPVQTGRVEVQSGIGKSTETGVDAMGIFTIQPIPASPFRLRCRGADGIVVLTEWLRL